MTPKRKVILALLLAMLASGLATTVSLSPAWGDGVEVTTVLLASLLVFAWYFEDARERAFRRGYWQDFGVAGLALVGLPVYFYRSRGAWRGTLATGGALLFYLLMLLTMLVGSAFGLVARLVLGMPVSH